MNNAIGPSRGRYLLQAINENQPSHFAVSGETFFIPQADLRFGNNGFQFAKHLIITKAGGEGILTTIYGVLVFLPWWAVQFRRLHDTDRSAWWLLLLLIPVIGWLVILIFNCQRGTEGNNRFGPDPKPFSY